MWQANVMKEILQHVFITIGISHVKSVGSAYDVGFIQVNGHVFFIVNTCARHEIFMIKKGYVLSGKPFVKVLYFGLLLLGECLVLFCLIEMPLDICSCPFVIMMIFIAINTS